MAPVSGESDEEDYQKGVAGTEADVVQGNGMRDTSVEEGKTERMKAAWDFLRKTIVL